MTKDAPAIGRIVHHVGGTGTGERYGHCQAAIITALDNQPPDSVELCVFDMPGPRMLQNIRHNEQHDDNGNLEPHTWHWPERT